jgi:hypothetical protein
MAEALQRADHEVELVLLPEQRHHTRGSGIRIREQRTVTHLLAGLGLPLPADLR